MATRLGQCDKEGMERLTSAQRVQISDCRASALTTEPRLRDKTAMACQSLRYEATQEYFHVAVCTFVYNLHRYSYRNQYLSHTCVLTNVIIAGINLFLFHGIAVLRNGNLLHSSNPSCSIPRCNVAVCNISSICDQERHKQRR